MILRRPIVTLTLLGLAWQVAVAGEPGTRAKPYYAYPADAGGSSPTWEGGSLSGRQSAAGALPAWTGSSVGGERGGAYSAPAYSAPAAGASRERPPDQFRFRQRAEDRRDPPDTLRYRPDPDLARRSYQNWAVPGQEWSEAPKGPAVIFRPREQESSSNRRPQSTSAYPEAMPPAGPGYGTEWGPGYGLPY